MVVGIVSSSGSPQELLTVEDISAIVIKIPNFNLLTITTLKPWISDNLDFTRMRLVLESCSDKNARIEVLSELTSVSVKTLPSLKCSDIRSILITLPQRIAEKGLKVISHLITPDLDINRVELVFECVMKTDQVKVLTTLLSNSNTRISSMHEIRTIIEKMDQPFRGLECLKDKIETSIDLNKIATVLNVIPSIKRVDTTQLLLEHIPLDTNSSKLSAFDMRSVLMLMEANASVEVLRLLLPRFEVTSDRDLMRILECFSDATRPVAEKILQQQKINVKE